MGKNRRRWNRKWVWDTNICLHLCHPCTNFKCLSVMRIINMLSIIVHYYFCTLSTHKPVITWSLWDQDFLHRLHYKMMSEIFHIFRKCPNRLNLLQGDQVMPLEIPLANGSYINFSKWQYWQQRSCSVWIGTKFSGNFFGCFNNWKKFTERICGSKLLHMISAIKYRHLNWRINTLFIHIQKQKHKIYVLFQESLSECVFFSFFLLWGMLPCDESIQNNLMAQFENIFKGKFCETTVIKIHFLPIFNTTTQYKISTLK